MHHLLHAVGFGLLATAALLSTNGVASAASIDKEAEVRSILERMENDVKDLRDEVERAYALRCDTSLLSKCAYANYDDCSSTFPNQQCMEPDELVISECGDGTPCNALWDKTVSTVTFPSALARGANGNPTDSELIETACYSLLAEPFMVQKYQNDEAFWSTYQLNPSWTYLGAHNGMFRQIPATHQKVCGTYDPRRRPWFVAASSGPKDVVLVLDVSGSMADYGRMQLAIEAASTVVDTLTVADRVAIVPFSTDARILSPDGEAHLIRATKENKMKLINLLKSLRSGGSTNFYAGFQMAFEALQTTIKMESTTGCNIAILFMTDGQLTEGPGENEVISLVNELTQQLSTQYGRTAKLFTFSLGVSADTRVPKRIACETQGLWTPVEDLAFGGDLVTAMSSYYKLFAQGLGENGNTDFVAWVEPYKFFTAGKMGTTVSAPVFDRSVDPPLFLGVVAIDSFMDALEQVLGEDAQSSTMLDRFVLLSTARCPGINLTECELDALRYLGGGEEATCGRCSSGSRQGIIPESCAAAADLPRDLWKNNNMIGMAYEDRACCEVGQSIPSDQCPNTSIFGTSDIPVEAIGGVIAAVVVAFAAAFCFCYYRKRKAKNAENARKNFSANANADFGTKVGKTPRPGKEDEPEIAVATSVVAGSGTAYDGVNVAPPPVQPGFVQDQTYSP